MTHLPLSAQARVPSLSPRDDAAERAFEKLMLPLRHVSAGRGWGPLRSNGRVRWCFVLTRFVGNEQRGRTSPSPRKRGSPPSPPAMTRAERAFEKLMLPLRRVRAGERVGPIAKRWEGEVVLRPDEICRLQASRPTSPSPRIRAGPPSTPAMTRAERAPIGGRRGPLASPYSSGRAGRGRRSGISCGCHGPDDRLRLVLPLILRLTLIGAVAGAAYGLATANGASVTGLARGALSGAFIAAVVVRSTPSS